MKILLYSLIGLTALPIQANSLKKEKIEVNGTQFLVTSCESIYESSNSIYFQQFHTTTFGKANGFMVPPEHISEFKRYGGSGENIESQINTIMDIEDNSFKTDFFSFKGLKGWFENIGSHEKPTTKSIELACIKNRVRDLIMMYSKELTQEDRYFIPRNRANVRKVIKE